MQKNVKKSGEKPSNQNFEELLGYLKLIEEKWKSRKIEKNIWILLFVNIKRKISEKTFEYLSNLISI